MEKHILEAKNISLDFGGLKALTNVSCSFQGSEISGLIGPNGAGKTTLFNCLTGFLRPSSGQVLVENDSIPLGSPLLMSSRGIIRTFQNIALLPSLSILDNVLLGAHAQLSANPIYFFFRRKESTIQQAKFIEKIKLLFKWFEIEPYLESDVGTLPMGILKKIEIIRSLIAKPKILLLDEPASGLTQTEIKSLTHLIKKIRAEFKIPIVIIEHNIGFVRTTCDRMIALDAGKKIADGSPDEVCKNPKVIETYLGKVLPV